MSNYSSAITTLHNLLDYEIRTFISGEVFLKNVLPEWMNKASSIKLKSVLQKYLGFTQEHLDKLEPFVQGEEISSLSIYNRIMRAFIDDAEEKITHCADAEVKDACLLASVQLINHYKICAYGTAAAFANALNEKDQASVFHGAEINEKQIDDRLSQLAEHEINTRAKTPIVLTM